MRNWKVAEKDRIMEYNIAGTKIYTPEMIEHAKRRFTPPGPIKTILMLLVSLKVPKLSLHIWHFTDLFLGNDYFQDSIVHFRTRYLILG